MERRKNLRENGGSGLVKLAQFVNASAILKVVLLRSYFRVVLRHLQHLCFYSYTKGEPSLWWRGSTLRATRSMKLSARKRTALSFIWVLLFAFSVYYISEQISRHIFVVGADSIVYSTMSNVGLNDTLLWESTDRITPGYSGDNNIAVMQATVRAGHKIRLRFSHNVFSSVSSATSQSYTLTRTVDGESSGFTSVSGKYTISPEGSSNTSSSKSGQADSFNDEVFDDDVYYGNPRPFTDGRYYYIERGVYVVSFDMEAPLGDYTFCEQMTINEASSQSCAKITVISAMSQPSIDVSWEGDIDLDVIPGSFGSVSKEFDVSTDNYSGYTLSFIANGDSGNLVKNDDEEETIPSISSVTTEPNFNIGYGYRIDGSNSNVTISNQYSPIPYSTEDTIETTDHSKLSDTYTLSFGVKTSAEAKPGIYSSSYTIATVANPAVYYSVTYNKNTNDTVTGMPANVGSTTIVSNTLSFTPANSTPVRDGYDFMGWTKDSTSTTPACTSSTSCEFNLDPDTANDLILYAVWEQKYVISYNANGGTYDGSNDSGNIEDQIVGRGSSVELADNWYHKDGYFFTGWATSAEGDAEYYPGETITPSNNITIYASWKEGYWYEQNSGTGGDSGNTGGSGDSGNTGGGDSGNTGGDSGNTGGDSGNTGGTGTGTGTGGTGTGTSPDPGTNPGTGTGTNPDPVNPGTGTGGGSGTGGGGSGNSGTLTGMKLRDAVATLSRGTLAENNVSLTDTINKGNSGVYKYDPTVYGASSDASNEYDIYFYRGILDRTTGTYGSDGDSINWPNYVKLDNDTCWRIVRTTGSGGTKLIYNGTYANGTCAHSTADAQIGTSAFSSIDRHYIQSVGYISVGEISASATNSDCTISKIMSNGTYYWGGYCSWNTYHYESKSTSAVKTAIDTWFTNNMSLTYQMAYEDSFGMCDDRLPIYTRMLDGGNVSYVALNNDNEFSSGSGYYYGTSNMTPYYFQPYLRNSEGDKPSLSCNVWSKNYYAVSYINNNNSARGLLNADEASFAGSGYGSGIASYNYKSFLNTGSSFWTISPSMRGSNGNAFNFIVGSDGSLWSTGGGNLGVRPVISLRNSEKITGGSGTATSPWTITRSTATKVGTPSISLDGATVQFSFASDEYSATGYDVYVDGVLSQSGSAYESEMSVAALNLTSGDHTIKVKAKRDGLSDSDFSNSVVYTVQDGYALTVTVTDMGERGDLGDRSGYYIKVGTAPTSYDDYDIEVEGGYDSCDMNISGSYYEGWVNCGESVTFTAIIPEETPNLYIWGSTGRSYGDGLGGSIVVDGNDIDIHNHTYQSCYTYNNKTNCYNYYGYDYENPYTFTMNGNATIEMLGHGDND